VAISRVGGNRGLREMSVTRLIRQTNKSRWLYQSLFGRLTPAKGRNKLASFTLS
jgi:hypothetical protein